MALQRNTNGIKMCLNPSNFKSLFLWSASKSTPPLLWSTLASRPQELEMRNRNKSQRYLCAITVEMLQPNFRDQQQTHKSTGCVDLTAVVCVPHPPPGMNAAVRAVVRMGIYVGAKVYFIHEVSCSGPDESFS